MNSKPDQLFLTADQITLLRCIACRLVAAAAGQQPLPPVSELLAELDDQPVVGAFVTLRHGGALRGCIGNFTESIPLGRALERAATGVVSHDPRFPTVTVDELPQLTVELSLLHSRDLLGSTAAERMNRLQLGKHGLDIQHRGHTGLLLPRVPIDHGWDKLRFLAEVCRKAGLPDATWEDPEATLYGFQSICFGGPFAAADASE